MPETAIINHQEHLQKWCDQAVARLEEITTSEEPLSSKRIRAAVNACNLLERIAYSSLSEETVSMVHQIVTQALSI